MERITHKWSGKPIGNCNDYKGGLGVVCVNCGCVKEIIRGRITYFLNDTVTERAPKCKDNPAIADSPKTK